MQKPRTCRSGAIEYLGYSCWVVMCLYAVVLLVLEHCYLTEMARHDAKYKAEKEAHEIRFEQYRKWLTEPNLWVNRN